MVKLIAAPIILLVLHLSLAPSTATLVYNCYNTDGTYTTNSPYKTNLDSLFTKATSTDIPSGFYNLSAGQSPNAANLISLCLGNVSVSACHTCQNFVISNIKSHCPNQKTAIAWSDDCFVRYSNKPIFGALAEEPGFYMRRGLNASGDDADKYKSLVKTLLESLPGNGSAGDSNKKFAAAQGEFNSSLTVFAAAQCTPDLTQKECSDCVELANNLIQWCSGCSGQRGARVLLPSCNVRYEENEFYLSESPAPTPTPEPSSSPSPGSDATLLLWVYNCSNTDGNYTTNSPYKTNLDSLFTKAASTDISSGFYNLSAGQSPDAANLISLCVGNVGVSACHTCQNFVISNIKSLCPNQKTAIAWSDYCFVRYSNKPIFGVLAEEPVFLRWRGVTASGDVDKYKSLVKTLLESLPGNASAGDSEKKFAAAQGEFNSSIKVYADAQCTPDLTQKECSDCVKFANNKIQSCSECSGQRGARVLLPSCNVRYVENEFYLSESPAPTPTPESSSSPSPGSAGKGSGKRTTKIIVAAVAGSLCLLLVIVVFFIFIRKRKLHWNLITNKLIDGDDISNIESLQFNFSTIRAATENFSKANKLGEGGFGVVYKGTLPDNGQEIAVKRLAGNSSQGEEEFKTEVTLLANLQHRNLVRLRGFCFHDKERLLIYEFVANASLDHFLFGETRRAQLDWETRYKIIRGIARGILYLHEDSRLRIIHRDLKASNVLLDAEMCPKIADFGTARLFEIDQTHSDTRRIVGTYGYMAPEYVLHGNFSTKSDVYSFGVLLLEIVCGKRCSAVFTGESSGSLISLIWKKWSEGTPLEVVDSAISDGPESEILRCIHIGLLCIQDNKVDRPTMSSVVLMMSSGSLALPLPSHPAYIMTSNMPLNSNDINWSTDRSTDLESITDLNVR